MNGHHYDPERASALLPLLRAIVREMRDRAAAVDALERRLANLGPARKHADLRARLEGDVAVHRKELRETQRELERLGCKLDADHPLRVLIPGADGVPQHGWAWTPWDDHLRSLALAG